MTSLVHYSIIDVHSVEDHIMNTDKQRHGGPYDRGSADSYYRRGYAPHYFIGESYTSDKVEEAYMTPEEISEYKKGFGENILNHKEWV